MSSVAKLYFFYSPRMVDIARDRMSEMKRIYVVSLEPSQPFLVSLFTVRVTANLCKDDEALMRSAMGDSEKRKKGEGCESWRPLFPHIFHRCFFCVNLSLVPFIFSPQSSVGTISS